MTAKTTTITMTAEQLQEIVTAAVTAALAAQSPAAPAKPKAVSNAQPKAVKADKPVKVAKQPKAAKPAAKSADRYTVKADKDTRDDSALWTVKVNVSLSRDEYKAENERMKSIGGYYSRFKHAFVFRYDPTAALKSGKMPKGAPRAEYSTKKGTKTA